MGFGNHMFVLLNDGTVKAFGKNDVGQLGLGHTTSPVIAPTTVPISNVKQIATGWDFTFFLLKDGTVKGVGDNARGQLGLGNTDTKTTVVDIPITGVKQIACGRQHVMFLMNDGKVKSCGFNATGQLGLGYAMSSPPQYVATISDVSVTGVKQLACGADHTVFLFEDGTVRSVGFNYYGQLGLGHTTSPVNTISPVSITGVKQLACGNSHTLFLLSDGTVKGCGRNFAGQLGIGNMTDNITALSPASISGVKAIACQLATSYFLMNDGSVKACGNNYYGQLANGSTTNDVSSPTTIASLTGVTSIGCGDSHAFFKLGDGSVKSVGYNQYGQLGTGAVTASPYAVTSLQSPSLSGVSSLADSIITAIIKFLLDDGGVLKKIGSLTLTSVGVAPATEAMFQQGMDDVSGLVTAAAKDTLTLTSRGALGAGAGRFTQ